MRYFIVILYNGCFYTDEDFDSFEEACIWAHHHITETIPALIKTVLKSIVLNVYFQQKKKKRYTHYFEINNMNPKCRLCKTPTETGFNINFDLVPVCERCAMAITLQQVQCISKQYNAKFPTVEGYLDISKYTCNTCEAKLLCKYAFDGYNTNGTSGRVYIKGRRV